MVRDPDGKGYSFNPDLSEFRPWDLQRWLQKTP